MISSFNLSSNLADISPTFGIHLITDPNVDRAPMFISSLHLHVHLKYILNTYKVSDPVMGIAVAR